LFGKGVGNQHPFESYVNFLVSNDLSPDTVVTTIAFNTNAETMELVFSPLRELSDEEFEVVLKAQQDPMAKRYTRLTVAEADKVTVKPSAIAAPKPAPVVEEPVVEEAIVEEAVEEPKKRTSKKEEAVVDEDDDMSALIGEWGGDES
jgi:esterase/lipase superfamily enzyme